MQTDARPELDGYRAAIEDEYDYKVIIIRFYANGEPVPEIPYNVVFRDLHDDTVRLDLRLELIECFCRLLNSGMTQKQIQKIALGIVGPWFDELGELDTLPELGLFLTRREVSHEVIYKQEDGSYLRVVEDEFSEVIPAEELEEFLSE